MAELKAKSEKARFGDVRDITAVDYVQEVNKAGEGIMVVLHLYKQVQYSCTKIFQKQLLNNFLIFLQLSLGAISSRYLTPCWLSRLFSVLFFTCVIYFLFDILNYIIGRYVNVISLKSYSWLFPLHH